MTLLKKGGERELGLGERRFIARFPGKEFGDSSHRMWNNSLAKSGSVGKSWLLSNLRLSAPPEEFLISDRFGTRSDPAKYFK
jgi:hypothetical protein